jgi:hypothetical protein
MIKACQDYQRRQFPNKVFRLDAEFDSVHIGHGRGGGVGGGGGGGGGNNNNSGRGGRGRGGRGRGGRGRGGQLQRPDTEDEYRAKSFLSKQADDKLEHLPATLHAYVGMHVIITKNVSLPLGQGNGTLAVITGFVWPKEALLSNGPHQQEGVSGRWEKIFHTNTTAAAAAIPEDALVFVPDRLPTEILIRPLVDESIKKLSAVEFHDLSKGMYPVSPVSESVSVPFPGGGRGSAKATMKQFPLLCADALTIYKLQGQTCKGCLHIPTWSRMGMQEVYVAISRVKHIEQLHFGEEISDSLRVNWRLPLSLQNEMERLDRLSDNIISRLGQC